MSSQVLPKQASPALEAWVGLLRAHAATTRLLSAELQAEHGLSINDYEALLHLSREGGHMRRVDLAQKLLLTQSGVTRLLEGLERCGLVEKGACSTDLRVTYAVLTEAGRTRLEEASRSHLAAVRALFAENFSDEDVAQLAGLLGRLPGAGVGSGADCSP